MKYEKQGMMASVEEAIEILSERIPKNITPQGVVFEEEYNKAVRRAIYHMKRCVPVKPKHHKGKRIMQDYWNCANCGRIVDGNDKFCRGCGTEIKWDSPACLTGINEPEEKEPEQENKLPKRKKLNLSDFVE